MTVVQDHTENLNTIIKAAKNGHLALVECRERATGKTVAAICAVFVDEEGMYNIVPFATMFDGNPYELIDPPDPNGGFASP